MQALQNSVLLQKYVVIWKLSELPQALLLTKKYKIFIPMVDKVIRKHRISHQRYELLTARVMKGGSDFEIEDPAMNKVYKSRPLVDSSKLSQFETSNTKKLYVSAAHLQRAWAVSRRVSKDDWLEWHRRLSIELLKESPSPALRSCWTVAQQYAQLARDLFTSTNTSMMSRVFAGGTNIDSAWRLLAQIIANTPTVAALVHTMTAQLAARAGCPFVWAFMALLPLISIPCSAARL